jgi:hypothetical protein
VAILIGAGVGATVSLAAQFVGDRLATRRDRRSQRRERLHGVITEAALALYTSSRREPITEEELAQIKPGTVGAIDPETNLTVAPHVESTLQAMTLLMVHFGHDHLLVDEYVKVMTVSLKAESDKARHWRLADEAQKLADVPEMARTLRAAQVARDGWMRLAREEVDLI